MKTTKKCVFFLLCLFSLLETSTSFAQVFWTEGFQNNCSSLCTAGSYTGPNGSWITTSTGTNDAQANIWYISGSECGNAAGTCGTQCGTTDPSLHIGANNGTSDDIGASYDAGTANAVITNIRAESPVINCTGYSNIILSFNYIENGDGTNDDGSLWYYNGSVWAQIANTTKTSFGGCSPQGLWTIYSITLPASANNNPGIKIGFNWTNNNDGIGTDPSFAIDDITLTQCNPNVNAGANQTICLGNNQVVLNGTSSTGSGNWTSTGTGTFNNATLLNPVYTLSGADVSSGTITIILTSTNNAGCSAASDSMIVTVSSLPNVNAGPDDSICSGQSVILTSSGASNYSWNTGATTSAIIVSPLFTTTYTVTGTDINGCVATDSLIVTVRSNTDLIGNLNFSGGNVTGGNVFFIKQGASSALYDTISVVSPDGGGNYTFASALAGNYYIRAEANTLAYPTTINTYFGNAYLWDSAVVINHGCVLNDTNNITMLEVPVLTGSGKISGTVVEGVGFGQKIIPGNVVPYANVIPGVPTKVGRNPSGTIVASTVTDSNGVYTFTNLPIDDYKIYVDIPGYPMDSSYVVSITSTSDSVVNLDYIVDSNSVYIDLTTSSSSNNIAMYRDVLTVFPNPVNDNAIVIFETENYCAVQFDLYTLQGEKIATFLNHNFEKGKFKQVINFDQYGLTNGTYIIKAFVNNMQHNVRLVVIR